MDPSFPDWNFEAADFPILDQRKSTGQDNEIVELLWRNGEVVLNRQTQKNQAANRTETMEIPEHDQEEMKAAHSSCTFIEDDTASWIQYPFDEYSFDRDFSSNFFFANFEPVEPPSCRPFKRSEAEKLRIPNPQQHDRNRMPPPLSFKPCEEARNEGKERAATSGTTVGTSHCASNHFTNNNDSSNFCALTTTTSAWLSEDDDGQRQVLDCDSSKTTHTRKPNASSSSGGSACGMDRTSKQASGGSGCNKPKSVELEEYSESQSEAAENRSTQRSAPYRRSRAAEVHNLSERRRRDRINAKMKALQELIPHCNRTDKVSILDAAIEYLKSLQLQLQVMWMGSGMAGMAFAGVQPCMTRMNMAAMASTPLMPTNQNYPLHIPAVQNPGLIPQVPMHNQMQMMQNQALSEQFSQYMGALRHVQAARSQPQQQSPSTIGRPSEPTDNDALNKE